MKRIIVALFTLLLLPLTPARADSVIILTSTPHRDATGIFINDQLAQDLTAVGDLGKTLFNRNRNINNWIIDVGLIEEAEDLGDGYSYRDASGKIIAVEKSVVAQIWLTTLRQALRGAQVSVVGYGNPSIPTITKIAPNELSIVRTLAQRRLATWLGRDVAFTSFGAQQQASRSASELYKTLIVEVSVINSLITTPDIETLRLGLIGLLNPGLSNNDFAGLSISFTDAVAAMKKRIRIAAGNYTVTSSSYALPVTVINDFDQQVNVDVDAWTSNARVVVGTIPRITVGAKSQLQIKVPLKILASGETTLALQLHAPNGDRVGNIEEIPLRLAVISPLTTWFIVGMALILLVAAIVQSVRRVKRRRNDGA
jgi:hypothetical protein